MSELEVIGNLLSVNGRIRPLAHLFKVSRNHHSLRLGFTSGNVEISHKTPHANDREFLETLFKLNDPDTQIYEDNNILIKIGHGLVGIHCKNQAGNEYRILNLRFVASFSCLETYLGYSMNLHMLTAVSKEDRRNTDTIVVAKKSVCEDILAEWSSVSPSIFG